VLLVDDDLVCNMANEMALKRVSYEAVSATDGGAALTLLSDNAFDLVLLDIEMPGMNGVEVCQRLRSIPHHQNTPVIFVTLHGDFQNRAQSVLSGGDDFISKPISPLELIVKATVFMLNTPRAPIPRAKRRPKPAAPSAGREARELRPASQEIGGATGTDALLGQAHGA
jgi:DNA-binding response OmpR family regulator